MKNKLKLASACVLMGLASCSNAQVNPQPDLVPNGQTQVDSTTKSKKRIKLAILLDTSGSMDGLIEQAKNQLWKIVNQLAKAKDENGQTPYIEIALYHYGNDGNSILDGYVQKISDFTTELDEISEKLFALKTNGGSEYCGTVIKKSIQELKWSDSAQDLQLIFIAGNEEFTQGNVHFRTACALAKEKNIIVNTIYCGEYNEGVRTYWSEGATCSGGKYMNINADAQIVHITSPYDVQINILNVQLNETYLPYGKTAIIKKEKQLKEDNNAEKLGSANMTNRIMSKSSSVYKNTTWDLVDASEEKDFAIQEIKMEDLPEEMQNMNEQERIKYIEAQKLKRTQIKTQIEQLGQQREKYVAVEKQKMNIETQLDDVMIQSIEEQAKTKAFTFK